MRVAIVGGGPGGLYLAILLKREDPAREVTVFERNGPDDTFGWGVVFSDRTLSYVRESDPETHGALAAAFETWDNVDVVHRGEKVTIRGNRFSGIERLALLKILQRRAAALGVDVRFRTEARDPAALKASHDLLVGADGVNSIVRRAFEDRFRPALERRPNRYIWLGTRRLFHGLTLTFREDEAGLWAAHSYKYGPAASTFIVETDEETFRRSRIEERPLEEQLRTLERVFSDDLAGHPLLSNASRWIQFAFLRAGRFRHENVVLIGDALHTVHFSIGSGTKLALEDAIALAGALAGVPAGRDAVAAALDAFERARRPAVEDYQAAAAESMAWFERVKDFAHLDPLPFAYRCMLRSTRIDHEGLRRRDPAFVAACERWAAAHER